MPTTTAHFLDISTLEVNLFWRVETVTVAVAELAIVAEAPGVNVTIFI